MKTIKQVLGLVVMVLFFLPGAAVVVGTSSTNPPTCRLTVELRDSSRVIGECDSDHLKVHSELLGDMKFWVKDIRSVECVSTNTAKLLTANGDTLVVWFAEFEVTVKTSFGKVKLPVDLIRKVAVSSSGAVGARPPGLVALCRARIMAEIPSAAMMRN